MRRALLPAILALAGLAACRTPEPADASGYGRYRFMLEISPDATAGFVCIASVTDQMGRGTLTTRPFRVLPGKSGSAVLDEPVSGSRLEATVKVDAAGKRATYQARLVQKEQRTVVYEATKDIPRS
ncbi:MAG: hypothetical protein U0P81_15045 [Holophagaceae bacterium]